MLQAFALVALLSLAMNVKLFIDVKQYQSAYDATVSSISYLSGQVTDLMGQLTQANNQKKKLEQKVEAKRFAAIAASSDAECLAKNIYYEAGGESYAGKLAVAFVVLNRIANPAFPKSACGVVYQEKQFSWTFDNTLGRVVKDSTAWQDSYKIAVQVLANGTQMVDITHGALYFHNDTVKPKWATRDKFTTQIDGHFFYRQVQ